MPRLLSSLQCVILGCLASIPVQAALEAPDSAPTAIPFDQLGAEAQKQYSGDGIAIMPTAAGARLRASFQKLEAEATTEGLWLKSTEQAPGTDRFRMVATAFGREGEAHFELAPAGQISMYNDRVNYVRPGLIEEYRVSMDGVRQDFLVLQRPAGQGQVSVSLEVTGATATQSPVGGVELALSKSQREIAYSRLHVTDATGRELAARMEVVSANRIQICVDDNNAFYPLRIDPTFSDADWGSLGEFPGTNGYVSALTVAAGNLYVGGDFTVINDVAANRIAKWNGSSWSAFGSGINGAVRSIVVSGANVYAGGNFTVAGGQSANYVAKWNGSSWSALGSGTNGVVIAMAMVGTDLYAGGIFQEAGGQSASNIAKWNGSSWSRLTFGVSSHVNALAVSGTDLYVGGSFNAGSGKSANIAKWDGTAWSALGSGIERAGPVAALAVSGTVLYAGGSFTTAGGQPASKIAKWDGSSWSALGSGMDSEVYALTISGSTLYAGGRFTTAGGQSANKIAKWDGSSWSALGSGTEGEVHVLAVFGTNLYAGSEFSATAKYLTRWDGSSWNDIGSGINGGVLAVAVAGADLFAGGQFTTVAGQSANRVAKWDGSSWIALSSGMNAQVNALTVLGTDLYAGGNFTTAGGLSANRIAKWDGSVWSPLGSGMDGNVNVLAVSGTDLYAGGAFTSAGGQGTGRFAKWNGTSWSSLDNWTGPDSTVYAIATSGADVYLGGAFGTVSGQSAKRIVKWNGFSWSALGAGLNGVVHALKILDGDIYVGGAFTTAGGQSANRIAKWNGASWSPLGSGMDSDVLALTVFDNTLYAGGKFSTAGGQSVNHMAQWNGSSWSAIGSGVNGEVHALAASNTDIFAGGYFTVAGAKVSAYATHLDLRAELEIAGKGISISNHDFAPTPTDDTDFGSALVPSATIVRTFTITNSGRGDLKLTGAPLIQITGAAAGDFAVSSLPASLVTQNQSTSFSIAFTPSAVGLRTATASVATNDPDDNPYTFAIQGTGVDTQTVAFTAATFAVNQGATEVSLSIVRTNGSILPFEVTINTDDGTPSTVPPFAAAMAGTDYTDLSGPATTVSFAEGVTSQIVIVPLFAKTGTSVPNKRFTATISAPTNGITLGSITTATIQILATDTVKPTLTITAPAANAKVSATLPYSAIGTVGDAKGIDRVEVVHNGADAVQAVLGSAKASTSIPYSLPILPPPGANTIVVTAYDLRGNSTTVTRSFTFTRRYLLTLTRSDPAVGTVALAATPAASASALTPTAVATNPKTSQVLPGATVKLTATPKTGFVFSHWSGLPGGATTLGNVASFAMPALDAAVTANFVATPFHPPAGRTNTFLGLLHPSFPPSTNANEGLLNGTLTATGAFTGKLFIDGVAQPITAAFFGNGSALFTVGAAKQTSLTFGGRTLTLTFEFASSTISASLVKGPVTSTGAAGRPLYSIANKVPVALLSSATATKGFYTVGLPAKAQTPPVDIATYPQGHGFATLNLTNSGSVSFTGTLADGTAITGSSSLLVSNTAPFLIQLPTPGASAVKGGSFSGVLALDTTPADSDILGANLLWFRAAAVGTTAATNLYTPGWPNGILVDAIGARYATATKVQATLGLPAPHAATGNAQLMFTDGKLTAPVIKTKFNITGNTVAKIPTTDASYTLALVPTTGAFNGTFTPNWASPATAKPGFKGIIIQKGLNQGGFGFFLSNRLNDLDPESGGVTLGRQE